MPSRRPRLPALATALLVAVAPALPAQPPTAPPPARPAPAPAAADSTARDIEAFARLQLAINALRDREQAELAEPRNKKVEEQAAIRARYRALRADSLKAHDYTPERMSAMTLRLSSDDALRARFEAAMERLGR